MVKAKVVALRTAIVRTRINIAQIESIEDYDSVEFAAVGLDRKHPEKSGLTNCSGTGG